MHLGQREIAAAPPQALAGELKGSDEDRHSGGVGDRFAGESSCYARVPPDHRKKSTARIGQKLRNFGLSESFERTIKRAEEGEHAYTS